MLFPGVTTLVIVITFIIMAFQLVKHIRRMIKPKVDSDGFASSSFFDRTPLMNRPNETAPASFERNKKSNNSEFV